MPVELIGSYMSSYIRVVDIALGAIMIWGAYKGFKRGFLLELISTAVFIAGVILVFYLVAMLFISTEEYVGSAPKALIFILYIVLFIVGSIVLNHFGKKLQEKVDYSVLDDFDNVAGLLLGLMKTAFWLAVVLGLLDSAGLGLSNDITSDSVIYPMLLSFQDWLVDTAAVVAPSIGDTAATIRKMLRR